ALAGRMRGAHVVGRKRLRHGEQRDGGGIAAGRAGGVGDAAVNGVETGGEIGHDGHGSRHGSGTEAGMKPMRRDLRRIDPLIIRTPRAPVMGANSP
ncbi:hypothetical protein M3579_18730, partial [Bacillus pumilus]|nr:hypothetical protein [Bacillus pumilus]